MYRLIVKKKKNASFRGFGGTRRFFIVENTLSYPLIRFAKPRKYLFFFSIRTKIEDDSVTSRIRKGFKSFFIRTVDNANDSLLVDCFQLASIFDVKIIWGLLASAYFISRGLAPRDFFRPPSIRCAKPREYFFFSIRTKIEDNSVKSNSQGLQIIFSYC